MGTDKRKGIKEYCIELSLSKRLEERSEKIIFERELSKEEHSQNNFY